MLRIFRANLRAVMLSSSSISTRIKERVALEITKLSRHPCLVVLLVGSRSDSLRYIRSKKKAAEECGIKFELINLSECISQTALHRELAELSADPSVDGILLQLPLPHHLRVAPALLQIHPNKDVDGLNPLNASMLPLRDKVSLAEFLESRLSEQSLNNQLLEDAIILGTTEGCFVNSIMRSSQEAKYFVPCTALSIRSILFFYLTLAKNSSSNVAAPKLDKLHVVVVNRSMVVGIPTLFLLQKEGFIVTLCGHNNPLDVLQKTMKTADIVITAYGQAEVFDAKFFKDGAVVIDAGINELNVEKCDEGNSLSTKTKICGDINIRSVLEVASAISPTPGGVGPLTVAYLMQNVLKASHLRHKNELFMDNIYKLLPNIYGPYDIFSSKSELQLQQQPFMETSVQENDLDYHNFDV